MSTIHSTKMIERIERAICRSIAVIAFCICGYASMISAWLMLCAFCIGIMALSMSTPVPSMPRDRVAERAAAAGVVAVLALLVAVGEFVVHRNGGSVACLADHLQGHLCPYHMTYLAR